MSRTTVRITASLITLGLLSGCATRKDQAMLEGCGGGALVGAALGAALGAAFGGGRGAAIGAGSGAALGAIGGCAYAYNLNEDYERLSGHEKELDAQIAFAQSVNQKTEAYNKQLRAEVASAKAEVDELTSKLAANQLQQSELLSERRRLQGKVDSANKELIKAKLALNKSQSLRAAQAQASPALDGEIKKLKSAVAETEASTAVLAAQSQRL